MKRLLRNEGGFTLIEVLAAATIGTMLVLLIGNALLFGLKQYKNQSTKARELTDVTYLAKMITKEIRKAETVSVGGAGKSLILIIDGELKAYEFNEESGAFTLNGNELISEIESLTVLRNNDSINILEIEIVHHNTKGKEERIDTEIYVRKGVNIEEH